MQFSGYKGNFYNCNSCYNFSLDLYQPTNHTQSLQLVSEVRVIGWFCCIICFGPDSFGLGYLSA